MSKVEETAYEELITALGTFKVDLWECAENMRNSARTCASIMEGDDFSTEASEQVETTVNGYAKVIDKVTKLQLDLRSDLEDIIAMRKTLESKEGE